MICHKGRSCIQPYPPNRRPHALISPSASEGTGDGMYAFLSSLEPGRKWWWQRNASKGMQRNAASLSQNFLFITFGSPREVVPLLSPLLGPDYRAGARGHPSTSPAPGHSSRALCRTWLCSTGGLAWSAAPAGPPASWDGGSHSGFLTPSLRPWQTPGSCLCVHSGRDHLCQTTVVRLKGLDSGQPGGVSSLLSSISRWKVHSYPATFHMKQRHIFWTQSNA